MGAKKLVRKPRSKDYKKIIDITQSILYSPKKINWFCGYLNLSQNRVSEAIEYLCYIGYLEKLPDNTYAVARDFRLKIRGIYHSDGENGHVHADVQRKIKQPIFVPKKWSMGAKHGDRVEIAIEGEFSKTNTGVVQEIINPWSDCFVGKLSYMAGKWYVLPCDKGIGNSFEILNPSQKFIANKFVYASFCDAEIARKQAFLNSSIAQQKKTILWSEICGGDMPEVYTEPKLFCNIIKVFDNDEDRINFEYENYSEKQPVIAKKKGKPYERVNLEDLNTVYVSDDMAVSFEQNNKRCYVHVPDLTQYISLNSDTEKRMLQRAEGKNLVSEGIKDVTGFKVNSSASAITVEFDKEDMSNTKIYRSVVFINSKENIENKDEIIEFANDAVAEWFDSRLATAPYVEFSKTGIGETLYLPSEITNQALNENFFVADVIPSGDFTVLFCNPFQNYLAFLTQHCFAFHNSYHTSREECEFTNLLREKCALYTYSHLRKQLYNIAKQNIKIDYNQKQGKEYPATYLYETNSGDGVIYCNGGYGLCESDKTLLFGAPVKAVYEDISLNRLDLYYRLKK